MTIFLETTFDAILKVNNKDYILQNGNVLKISEIDGDFIVFVFPKDTSKIPFSFLIKKDAVNSCESVNVQVLPLEKGNFYLRLCLASNKKEAKAQKLNNNFWVYESDDMLKVKNKEGADVLSTNFESYQIYPNGSLYVLKNHSKLLDCTLLQKYMVEDDLFKLVSEECVTQNKNAQNKIFDKENLPFAFFESCKAHFFSFAMSLLSENLKSVTNKESLGAFFENYKEIAKNTFLKNGYILIPNNQKEKLKLVDFVFDQQNKIDNVVEIL